MKYVWQIVVRHFRHYERMSLLWSTLLAAVLIFCNEHFQLYENYINREPNAVLQTLYYLIMYVGVYALTLLIIAVCSKSSFVLRQGKFWWVLILALLLFTVRGLEQYYWKLIPTSVDVSYRMAWFKLWYNASGLLLILLPCYFYYRWSGDAQQQPYYGFKHKGVRLKPYWWLLLIMIPVLAWAAQDPSFHTMYPRYRFLGIKEIDPLYAPYVAAYELAYSLDFVVTEFFFRGFLLLALGRFIGAKTVLPMAMVYITIHFGKPLPEIISSYFGGLLLGAITWETRSIYGGIIVHLGIALLMEIFGALL